MKVSKLGSRRWVYGRYLLIVGFLFAGFYIYSQTVSAATAVLVPNTDITTDWLECNAGTCTNDHYTYVDEDVASPNDSDFFGTGGPGVSGDAAVVEMGLTTATNVDTVSSIQVNIRARIQTVGSTADQISINLRIGGSLQTPVTVSPSTTAYGNHTATFNGSWTQAQLDGAQVVLTRIKNGSGNPTAQQDDVRISAVSATVTYSQNVTFDQSSYRWFQNSTVTGDYTANQLSNPSTLPTGSGHSVSWSPDDTYSAVGHDSSPFLTIYKRSGDTFSKLSNPATLPASTVYGSEWSQDGTYLATGHWSSPYLTIYKRSGDTFTKLSDPATLPAAAGQDVSWSPDGTYLTVVHGTSPYLTIYKRSGDTFTKLSDPASLPTGFGRGADWSSDGQYLSVTHSTSPYVTIYKRSGDTFTKLSDPATLPTGTAYSAAWSPDDTYLSIAHDTSPFLTIYKRSGDTFTKLSNPTTLPGANSRSVDWSPDGGYLVVDDFTNLLIYERSGDTFTALSGMPSATGQSGFDWSSTGGYIGSVDTGSPYVRYFKMTKPIAVGSALASNSTAAVGYSDGTPFRLRMTIHANTGEAPAGSANFKLQYAQRGADNVCDTSFTNETYADLSPSSGAIRFYDNAAAADGYSLTSSVDDPTHGAHSNVYQTYEESNNFTIANAIPAGDDGLWDFSLYNHSATVGTSWCFRAVTSTGATLASYVTIPEISVPVPSATQANYRWFENADSVTPGTVLAAQDTAATVAAETPVRLRQRIAVDSGGMVQNYQNYKLQYGEKVTTCSVASYDDVNSGDAVTDATLATSGSQDFSGDVAWSGSFTTLYAVGGTSGISVPAGQNQSTHTVTLTGFGFSIPTAATVTGVEVSANSSTVAFDTGGTANMIVGLNGVAGSSSKNQSLSSGGSQTIVLGGSTDLFGASSISPSAINQSTFGITARLSASADLAAVLNTQIYVDYFSVKIYYTIPSGAIQYHDNATPADGATISSTANDPTNSGRTAIYQTYRESDPFSNPTAIPAGQDGIWDFAFTSTSAADGKTYCFRVVESDDTPLNSYTYYPEITFGSGGGNGPNDPPTLDQSTRGGGGVVNGVKKNLSWRN